MPVPQVDVVVVGASLAGCTTAVLLARKGIKVALLERHAKPEAYKRLCTHFIQPSALAVLKRLGLDRSIEAAGGLRNRMEIHTPFGWIGHHLFTGDDGHPLHGYSIRRQRLDPMMRELAASTPGVTLMTGVSVRGLIERGGRIVGVQAHGAKEGDIAMEARLVVAADGRQSELAGMAGVKPKTSVNRRHGLAVPMRHVEQKRGGSSQMWMTGPEVAYNFPNDDGVTVIACVAPPAMLDRPRDEQLGWLKERFRTLPDAPGLEQAEPLHEVLAIKDFPGQWRPQVVRGMALVGDAASSLDYLQGVGCGWAFESAAWLADAVSPALIAGQDLEAALRAYVRRHNAAQGAHRFFINDFASRLDFNPVERLLYSAATRDVDFARRMMRVGARIDSPLKLLAPLTLAKAVWVHLRPHQPHGNDTRTEAAVQAPAVSASLPG